MSEELKSCPFCGATGNCDKDFPHPRKTPTNWPNPERPGYPMFPDRDGWHWISYCGTPRPLFWSAKSNAWFSSSGIRSRRENTSAHWEYIEPVLTPTQIAELLAGERERLDWLLAHSHYGIPGFDPVVSGRTSEKRRADLIQAIDAAREVG